MAPVGLVLDTWDKFNCNSPIKPITLIMMLMSLALPDYFRVHGIFIDLTVKVLILIEWQQL